MEAEKGFRWWFGREKAFVLWDEDLVRNGFTVDVGISMTAAQNIRIFHRYLDMYSSNFCNEDKMSVT